MNAAKIRLSEQEQELVRNAEWILTKNSIMQKVKWMLEGVQPALEQVVGKYSNRLPAEVLQPLFKISRGENYRGLPYMILDYPRYFKPEDIFAVRTLFWWGHYFSITLHLSGKYKEEVQEKICEGYSRWEENGFYIAVTNDPWQHHIETETYKKVASLPRNSFEQEVRGRDYLKLTVPVALQEWSELPQKAVGYAENLIGQIAGKD